MDWNVVIERNRDALKRILSTLVAMAAPAAPTLPRHLHSTILRLLRPAEAAARRLVIVVARDLVVPPPRPRKPKPYSIFVRNGDTRSGIILPCGVKPGDVLPNLAKPRKPQRSLALPLLDPLRGLPRPRRAVAAGVPRIWAPGFSEPYRAAPRHPPLPGDPIDATRLALRLQAVGRALDDLPGHARRFARWRQGAVAAGAQNGELRDTGRPRRITPLRPGRPPGCRPLGSSRRTAHEVDEVLADLHYFAHQALKQFQQKCAAVLRPEPLKDERGEPTDTS